MWHPKKRLKVAVAILANEFLAPDIERSGGFSWAAGAVPRTFAAAPHAHRRVIP